MSQIDQQFLCNGITENMVSKSSGLTVCHWKIFRILSFTSSCKCSGWRSSGETPLGIVRAAAVLLPWEKELERKGKQIHSFPSDKPGVPGEGRDEREMGLTQGVGEQQQRGCDHLILKPQHWGAPSAKSWQGETTELLLLLWFLTWGQGGEAQSWHPCQLLCLLASLGDSKVWIPCSEKEQKESAACLTRLGRGSGCVWLCVLTPLCFWRGVFYRKNGLGAV